MGLLDDLKMGLGLKERDKSYYERTAKTLANTQGEARAAQAHGRVKGSSAAQSSGK